MSKYYSICATVNFSEIVKLVGIIPTEFRHILTVISTKPNICFYGTFRSVHRDVCTEEARHPGVATVQRGGRRQQLFPGERVHSIAAGETHHQHLQRKWGHRA